MRNEKRIIYLLQIFTFTRIIRIVDGIFFADEKGYENSVAKLKKVNRIIRDAYNLGR